MKSIHWAPCHLRIFSQTRLLEERSRGEENVKKRQYNQVFGRPKSVEGTHGLSRSDSAINVMSERVVPETRLIFIEKKRPLQYAHSADIQGGVCPYLWLTTSTRSFHEDPPRFLYQENSFLSLCRTRRNSPTSSKKAKK